MVCGLARTDQLSLCFNRRPCCSTIHYEPSLNYVFGNKRMRKLPTPIESKQGADATISTSASSTTASAAPILGMSCHAPLPAPATVDRVPFCAVVCLALIDTALRLCHTSTSYPHSPGWLTFERPSAGLPIIPLLSITRAYFISNTFITHHCGRSGFSNTNL